MSAVSWFAAAICLAVAPVCGGAAEGPRSAMPVDLSPRLAWIKTEGFRAGDSGL